MAHNLGITKILFTIKIDSNVRRLGVEKQGVLGGDRGARARRWASAAWSRARRARGRARGGRRARSGTTSRTGPKDVVVHALRAFEGR